MNACNEVVGAPGRASFLSGDHIDGWRREGFLAVRGLFSAAECDAMRRAADDLAAAPQVPGGVRWYSDDEAAMVGRLVLSRIEYFRGFHPGLRSVMEDERLLTPLSLLWGEPAIVFKDKINYKIPGSSGFEAHQDAQAGWDKYCATQITVMVSLDATTLANGCLELAPAPHPRRLIGEMWKPLNSEQLEGIVFEPLETAPGDVCFFDAYVPHRSGANQTTEPRRVLYLTYNPASEGDHYEAYFADKRKSFPPDIERPAHLARRYRV